MKIKLVRALVAASIAVVVSSAMLSSSARASGRIRTAQTGIMFRVVFLMKANVTYTFSTSNLSAGSDTILHVASYPAGQFIAGNDDTTTTDPDTGQQTVQPFSSVSVPPVGFDRTVFLIVRGKPGTAAGTASFRILGFSGSIFNVVRDVTFSSIPFSQGFVQNVASLASATHITTVENTIGTTDTILMVVGSNPAITLGVDDDDGIDQMSFLRLGSACTTNCQIIVGTPAPNLRSVLTNPDPGSVTVVWDESLEAGDSDHDGLGDQFESSMAGFSPQLFDTDHDGLGDGVEVYGAILAGSGRSAPPAGGGKDGNLLKLPKYGADPTAPDVFVELDWAPGCPGAVTTCPAGSPAGTKDGFKFSPAQLQAAWSAMSTGNFRPHIDAGIATSPTDPNAMFGDWGGANRLTDGQVNFAGNAVSVPSSIGGTEDCANGVTVAREGFFHHYIVINSRPRSPYGFCGSTLADAGTLTHEIGHNFNLHHGGPANVEDANVNCKANYASVMSYPNQRLGIDGVPIANGYSTGRFAARVINGALVSETAGLGTTDSAILNAFTGGGAFDRGLVRSSDGAIDWNMDGIIGNNVRAPLNWARTSCAAPYMRANWNISQLDFPNGSGRLGGVTFPTLTVAEANTASPQLFAIGKVHNFDGSDTPALVTGTGDATNCGISGLSVCTTWPFRQVIKFGGVGSSASLPASALAKAGPILVYRDSLGQLEQLKNITATSSWSTVFGMYVASGIMGDPAAIEVNGTVRVYAIGGGQLKRWEFDEGQGRWTTQNSPEVWEDGTPINTAFGIAVAHGADQTNGLGVFAAIPNTNGVAAGQPVPIELARLVSTPVVVDLGFVSFTIRIDKWQRFALANRPTTSLAKPGLAYSPFNNSFPLDGRFYLTALTPGGTATIGFTEGNNPAGGTGRQLIWKTNQGAAFTDDKNQARKLPNGVVLARFGESIAGAASESPGITVQTHYFPSADGIFSAALKDYNEVPFILGNLPCSLRGCD